MKITKIYFDLDDVMVDWLGGVARHFGMEYAYLARRIDTGLKPEEVLNMSRGALFNHLDDEDFWANLSPILRVLELWEELSQVEGIHCRILTATIPKPACLAGKLRWMQEHLGGPPFKKYIITKLKSDLAAPGRLLLDDWEGNTSAFVAEGGEAIHFPAAGNTVRRRGCTVEEACDAVRKKVLG